MAITTAIKCSLNVVTCCNYPVGSPEAKFLEPCHLEAVKYLSYPLVDLDKKTEIQAGDLPKVTGPVSVQLGPDGGLAHTGMMVPREGRVQQADPGALTTMLTFPPAPQPLLELADPRGVKTFLPAWLLPRLLLFFPPPF